MAALCSQFRLCTLVIVGSVTVFLMRNLMHLIPAVEADRLGTDQPIAGQLTRHVDQQEFPGARFVIRLIL